MLRAWRWQALLAPIGRARFRTAFRTTVIGFAATFLLPARVGEVLRPYLLARQEGLNAAAAFATVIVERLLDLCTVLLLFALALFAAGIDVGRETESGGRRGRSRSVVGLAALFVLAGHPERLGRWAGRLARRLPPKAADDVGHLVQDVRRRAARSCAVPGTGRGGRSGRCPLWLSIALGIWSRPGRSI